MTREELFDAWAPPGRPWSDWVKPAPFAHLPAELPPAPDFPPPDLSWAPPGAERVAVVVDLPGAESVHLGLALAALGYQPVPLFNACPPPGLLYPGPLGDVAVVRVGPLLAALVRGANQLPAPPPAPDAPPVFLVDADRQAAHRDPEPGAFDNRSVVFVTDFPSAARLAAHGITRALLVRERAIGLGDDLRAALLEWQRAGMTLSAKLLTVAGGPAPLVLRRPWWWAGFWGRLAVTFGLWRSAGGDFGAFIPHPAGG